jgi:hypothetical protein
MDVSETDPVFDMFLFLVFRIPDDGQRPEIESNTPQSEPSRFQFLYICKILRRPAVNALILIFPVTRIQNPQNCSQNLCFLSIKCKKNQRFVLQLFQCVEEHFCPSVRRPECEANN